MSSQENRDRVEKEIKFELDFCSYIAGTEYYHILSLPFDINTNKELTFEEINEISLACKNDGIKLLFRVTMDPKHALVFTEDMNIIGVVPEIDPNGFHC